jgi:hypothetical protein
MPIRVSHRQPSARILPGKCEKLRFSFVASLSEYDMPARTSESGAEPGREAAWPGVARTDT